MYCVDVSERFPHAPLIVSAPRNQTVVVGGAAKFICKVFSDSMPHLQWLKHYEVNGSYNDENSMPYVRVVKVGGG